MTDRGPLCLGFLLSGSGRTLQNIFGAIQAGRLDARIGCVISSRPDAYGVERARKIGLPVHIVECKPCRVGSAHQSRRGGHSPPYHDRIAGHLDDAGVELVCMGGFLALWRFPPHYQSKVINIHPALLPDFGGKGFYGEKVHEAVLAAGRSVSGCTVHFCDNEYDHGPIILQREVPVLPGDSMETLAARVFEQECIAYPEAIQLFAEDRIQLADGKVTIV